MSITRKKLQLLGGWALIALGHLSATAAVSVVITVAVLPFGYLEPVARRVVGIEALWELSTTALLIHVALSACVWAFVFILYKLFQAHRHERPQRTLQLQRGSVMTETLIILPVYFLLTFGMSQLAINNIAGILANVAAYQGARAAWIWKAEEDASERRMGVTDGIAETKCRIAVGLVMLPVANGEFLNDPTFDSDYADKMRVAAVSAHIPFGGTLSGIDPDLSSFLAGGAALRSRIGFEGNRTMSRALDESSFMMRTASKFTHAYQASGCEIRDDGSVDMSYKLHVTMPLVGAVFGKLDIVSGRAGYFSEFKRDFGLPKQAMTPNAKLPVNKLIDFSPPDNPSESEIARRAEAGKDSDDVDIPDDCCD